MHFDEAGGVADDLRVEDRVTVRIVKRGDRHAPSALATDAPVGTRLHRAFDAVDARVGNPFHAVNLGEGGLAKCSSRRKEALINFGFFSEPPYVGCYVIYFD